MAAIPRVPATPLTRVAVILAIVVLLDLVAAFAVHVDRLDDPRFPSFKRADLSATNWSVDTFQTGSGNAGLTTEGPVGSGPDGRLRYALRSMDRYDRTGDPNWLRRAESSVRHVVSATRDGLVPHFSTRVDFAGREISPPWYDAETQGLLLSALARLYQVTGAEEWRMPSAEVFGALSAFRGFFAGSQPAPVNWLTSVDGEGYVWFDSFSTGFESSRTLTTQLWTALGIYDYARVLAADRSSRDARRHLLAGCVATIERYLPDFRIPGHISVSSLTSKNRDMASHFVAQALLDQLAAVTGRSRLARYAQDLDQDDDLPFFAVGHSEPQPGIDVYNPLPTELRLQPGQTEPTRVTRDGRPTRGPGIVDPLNNATFAIAALGRYAETGERTWLSRAESAVDVAMATTIDGALGHLYRASNVHGRRMRQPWYSSASQGAVLSALVRLHRATGDPAWLDQARRVRTALTRVDDYGLPAPRNWISFDTDNRGNLWFRSTPTARDLTANPRPGEAVLGLYDYWVETADPEVLRLPSWRACDTARLAADGPALLAMSRQ